MNMGAYGLFDIGPINVIGERGGETSLGGKSQKRSLIRTLLLWATEFQPTGVSLRGCRNTAPCTPSVWPVPLSTSLEAIEMYGSFLQVTATVG